MPYPSHGVLGTASLTADYSDILDQLTVGSSKVLDGYNGPARQLTYTGKTSFVSPKTTKKLSRKGHTKRMVTLRKMSLIYALDILMKSCRFCS